MKVTIFGAGYVGLVTGTCLAELGNEVLCVDVDKERIACLQQGICPIHEPDLPELMAKNCSAGRLSFTDDANLGVAHGYYQFIAVGTPQDEDGSADLKYVLAVAETIAKQMDSARLIVTKSTVPVGTAAKIKNIVQQVLAKRQKDIPFDVASNPEFLREGAAIKDFMSSDRIIIGTDNAQATQQLRELYAPLNRNQDRLIAMDIASAELTKYAANAMLATKISFINEISQLAERLGADVEQIRLGIGSDPRIGHHFISPGCGYGGSCFPKDLQALEIAAKQVNYDAKLLHAVQEVNRTQKLVLFKKMQRHYNNDLTNKVIALWGLAFKPNTDDMREAASLTLLEALWAAGARVQAYDPVAMPEALRRYGDNTQFKLCASPTDALIGADALAIVTEWPIFYSTDFQLLKKHLREAVLFDGRNLYDPAYLAQQGFKYYAIGRGA